MFDQIKQLYQADWLTFMEGTQEWLHGRSPYGVLSGGHAAGAFAYPPTALPWLAMFVQLGTVGFYVWTSLQLVAWWLLIRKSCRSQLLLLCWSPFILNLVEGQMTLAVVLALWAAYRAPRHGFLIGLALAWALSKPQVALIPLVWLLWQDRNSPVRWRLWGGIAFGTVLLALPATLLHPGIWSDWIASLRDNRQVDLKLAAWQLPGLVILVPAAYLWHRSRLDGWQWWLTAILFRQSSFYAIAPVLPVLRPRRSYWTLAGLGCAAIMQGPMTTISLPLILAGHMLAAWMIAGGPRSLSPTETRTRSLPSVLVSNETDHNKSLVDRWRGDHHDKSVLTHQQWLRSARLRPALIGDPPDSAASHAQCC
jgi:hypothetical protein